MAVGHACVCPLVRGPASYHRHQAIVGALASAADAQCSTIVDKAPVVVSVEKLFAGRDNGHVVPDLQFTSSLWSLATDVTVLYGEASSHKPQESALDSEAAKE
jgi:hypothetical protein